MNKRSAMLLKILINTFHPKNGEALLQFLPKSQADLLSSQHIHSTSILSLLNQPSVLIDKVHPSWIEDCYSKFPTSVHPILETLKTDQSQQIAKPVIEFFTDKLYSLLKGEERIPLAFLPQTPLSALKTFSKDQLIEVMTFLGLHDLASEMRTIVNKTHLNNLTQGLSPKEIYYLKMCLHQKEKLTTPPLKIDPSSPNTAALKSLLHKRGMIRFSKAIADEHPDFIWFICRTLDKKRGQYLEELCKIKESSIKVTEYLKEQLISLIQFLKKDSTSVQ